MDSSGFLRKSVLVVNFAYLSSSVYMSKSMLSLAGYRVHLVMMLLENREGSISLSSGAHFLFKAYMISLSVILGTFLVTVPWRGSFFIHDSGLSQLRTHLSYYNIFLNYFFDNLFFLVFSFFSGVPSIWLSCLMDLFSHFLVVSPFKFLFLGIFFNTEIS